MTISTENSLDRINEALEREQEIAAEAVYRKLEGLNTPQGFPENVLPRLTNIPGLIDTTNTSARDAVVDSFGRHARGILDRNMHYCLELFKRENNKLYYLKKNILVQILVHILVQILVHILVHKQTIN